MGLKKGMGVETAKIEKNMEGIWRRIFSRIFLYVVMTLVKFQNNDRDRTCTGYLLSLNEASSAKCRFHLIELLSKAASQ